MGSIIWPVWVSGWVFVNELSGCGFESRCCLSVFDYFVELILKRIIWYLSPFSIISCLYTWHHVMGKWMCWQCWSKQEQIYRSLLGWAGKFSVEEFDKFHVVCFDCRCLEVSKQTMQLFVLYSSLEAITGNRYYSISPPLSNWRQLSVQLSGGSEKKWVSVPVGT